MATGDAETALLIETTPDNSPVTSNSRIKKTKTAAASADFAFIKIIARLTLQLIRRFWAFSSAAALAIILFYWLCGGIVAFGLVAFAITGNTIHFKW